MTSNAFLEAFGPSADGEAAETIDLGHGITGRRQEDGRIAVFKPNGQPAGFSISEGEAAAMRR